MNAASTQEHAALSLAHRWFAFLESPAGNIGEHLRIFANDVRLSGRRGQVVFAHGHQELRAWFGSIPDEISSHRILHSTWTQESAERGRLDFVVAYQSPAAGGGVGGSIISYETVVTFESGTPRFSALDKTPILPNTRHEYSPTWAEHRVHGFVHAVLGGQASNHVAEEALKHLYRAGSLLDVWAPVPEMSGFYEAVMTVANADGTHCAARWEFHDDGDSEFPDPWQIVELHSLSAQNEEQLSGSAK